MIKEDYVMAIDAGTGSCRAVIFDRYGNQKSIAQKEWSHPTLPQYPGSQVFDTQTNWSYILLCIKEAMKKGQISPSQIRAVSSTSMREGMVLYDCDGKEIWACPNVDSRADEEARYLVKRGLARKIYFKAGDWVSITAPARFLWIKKHEPKIFKKIAHVTMISDWILYKLTGRYVTDPSIGSSSNMFDLKKRKWSKEIIEICGLPPEIFPDVYEPGTVIGEITHNASIETGLKEGTPVVLGGADTQLGLVGIGTITPHRLTIIGGSFWQHTIILDKPLIDPKIRLRTLCHAIPNQWMMEGIGFYCGIVMRWFRDAFCQYEKEQAEKLGVDPYSLMEKQAMSVPPGSNGVVAIFSNLMNAKQWIHASPAFIQFDVTNPLASGKKECIRAIEENAAYVSYGHVKIIEELTQRKFKEIVFTGGASKGSLWPQILADVLNVKIHVPVVKESTALGAALFAGIGAGFYKELSSAVKELVKFEKVYEPNQDTHKKYTTFYDKWLKIYAHCLEMVKEGLVHPMWKAAGT
ncbi:MAG: autoinducer-2 kinase [Nitrososphaerota archaeon]